MPIVWTADRQALDSVGVFRIVGRQEKFPQQRLPLNLPQKLRTEGDRSDRDGFRTLTKAVVKGARNVHNRHWIIDGLLTFAPEPAHVRMDRQP